MTEKKQTAHSHLLKSLIVGISHELNNPNNYMMLNSGMLQEAWEDIQQILENHYQESGDFKLGKSNYTRIRRDLSDMFSGIIEGGNRIRILLELLNEFVNLDKLNYQEPFSVNTVISASEIALKKKLCMEKRKLEFECAETIPLITGNPLKMEQALKILICNALEALENQNKRIIVGSSFNPARQRVTLFIKDEGHGIPENIMPFVWDPFFTTKKDNRTAIGMGLPIAKEIVRLHNGQIRIHSISQVGTEVIIDLPISG